VSLLGLDKEAQYLPRSGQSRLKPSWKTQCKGQAADEANSTGKKKRLRSGLLIGTHWRHLEMAKRHVGGRTIMYGAGDVVMCNEVGLAPQHR